MDQKSKVTVEDQESKVTIEDQESKVTVEENRMANPKKTDDDKHCEDQEEKLLADDQDGASIRSSAPSTSSTRSTRSRLSLLYLKESQKRAELISKTALLKKKQEIEKKKMELKWQEEQLDLDTDIEVNAAKTKLIEEAVSELNHSEDHVTKRRGELQIKNQGERIKKWEEQAAKEEKMQQNQEKGQNELYRKDRQDYTSKHRPQETQHTHKQSLQEAQHKEKEIAAEFVRQNQNAYHNQPSLETIQHSGTDSFVKMMKSSRLPVLEPDVFCGTVSEFPLWLKSVEAYIEQNTDSCIEQLHYLGKYTDGQARKAILGFLTLRSQDAYERAKHTLIDRYGNEFAMASAYRERIRSWPVIRNGDGKGLQEFVDFLSHCQSAMSECHSLHVLDDHQENAIMLKKLPRYLVERWRRVVDEWLFEGGTGHAGIFPPFSEFVRFLTKESRIASGPVQFDHDERSTDGSWNRNMKPKRAEARTFSASTGVTHQAEVECGMKECSQQHKIQDCEMFRSMPLKERLVVVQREGLCKACLGKGHVWRTCKERDTCDQCGRRHPTLLHDEALVPKAAATSMQTRTGTSQRSEGVSCSHTMVVPVYVYMKDDPGQRRLTYALLDPQSDACFIRESAADSLKADGEDISLELNTVTGRSVVKSKAVKGLVVVPISDMTVTSDLPVTYVRADIPADRHLIPRRATARNWKHLAELEDVLPPYFPDVEIELLIGMNCPRLIKPRNIVPGGDDDPWAVQTLLGWGIVGIVGPPSSEHSCRYVTTGHSQRICHFALRTTVKEISPIQVTRMFEQDFIEPKGAGQTSLSQDDLAFIQTVEEGLVKRPDGHYELPLPVRKGMRPLPNNKRVAVKRLHGLKARLKKNEELKREYTACIEENIQKGYAEEVPQDQLHLDSGKVWYLPHHCVEHPRKKKLRVVFDCSSEYEGRVLNDDLLSGPDQSNNLTGILCRFRKDKVAFCCDIEAMFYQVHVKPEDRNYLRFLWWRDGNLDGPIVEYRMTTHLFGATSSPGCSLYALRAAADEYEAEEGEEAAAFIRDNFYVDDGLASVSNPDDVIALINHAKEICAKGGFKLCKFSSNSAEVAQKANSTEQVLEPESSKCEQLKEHRVLGLLWNTTDDVFCFQTNLPSRPVSRRGILSVTSSIYDPLGLISPFVLRAKSILQDLCRDGLTWDDPVSLEIQQQWEQWLAEAELLKDVKVPRCYKGDGFQDIRKAELHSFSDASLRGYGACSYLRLVDANDNVSCHLVMSKSRVTPLKLVTVPRLELVAAVTAVKITEFLKAELKIKDLETFFWTDSKVVIGYVANDAKRFHLFVANRVQYIRDHTSPEQWGHVETQLNPADMASRGLRAADLVENELWWKGPRFLQSSADSRPKQMQPQLSEEDPEVKKAERKSATTFASSTTNLDNGFSDLLDRVAYFSSWYRAKRAVANCLRYKRILRTRSQRRMTSNQTEDGQSNQTEDGHVTVADLEAAETLIVKEVQKQCLNKENLGSLNPVVDKNGIIRVGGRLGKSSLSEEAAHPVILPRTSHVTELVVQHHHSNTAHSGRGNTLNEIRSTGYWIVGGRGVVSRHIWRCIACRKLRRRPAEQKMAELPKDRTEPEGPFTCSGVDLFGPFYIKERRSEVKRWIVLFCCMSSRAVHLETTSSLDTDSFINAFRRFVCRRGPVRQIRCDQGSNFVGGKNEWTKAFEEMDKAVLEQEFLRHNCDMVSFKFNVPHASHMGGSWERLIRSARAALTGLLSSSGHQLNDDSLRTLTVEVEALINSRPLTPVDVTESDIEPLSPIMLLTMKQKVVLPPPGSFVPPDLYCRRRWRRVQHLLNVFWERWRREFLAAQQQRSKWTRVQENVETDDIVLVVDDDVPRSQWRLGRVSQTYPSADGLVRKVKVAIGSTQYDRPIHRLIVLAKGDTP